jgi:HEAT repeat protein
MRTFGAPLALLVCALALTAQNGDDPKERVKAIRDLAKSGSEAIARIQPYLNDPDLEVRIEAVKAIDDIGGPRSVDPLIQAARDNDPEVQIRATDGLVNFYSPGYIKTGFSGSLRRVGNAIKGRWTDTNDLVVDPYVQVRPDVIAALGKLASGGASMEARANAARALGILRGRAALDDLIQALHSKDDLVIYESLIAIQKIHDPSAAPRIAFLLRDLNDKVQIAALETTGLLGNKQAIPQVRDAVDHARNEKIRRAALSALAMLPDESNRKIYSAYLSDKDDALRAAAAEGLARLKNPSDLPAMNRMFDSEKKMNARLAFAFAASALGNNGLSEFSPLQYLVNTLNSKAWRGVAQAYLVELARDPGIRRTLYAALQKGTRDEKIGLGQALAQSGDADTLKHLEALASDPDPDVSAEGLRALRTLKARL